MRPLSERLFSLMEQQIGPVPGGVERASVTDGFDVLTHRIRPPREPPSAEVLLRAGRQVAPSFEERPRHEALHERRRRVLAVIGARDDHAPIGPLDELGDVGGGDASSRAELPPQLVRRQATFRELPENGDVARLIEAIQPGDRDVRRPRQSRHESPIRLGDLHTGHALSLMRLDPIVCDTVVPLSI